MEIHLRDPRIQLDQASILDEKGRVRFVSDDIRITTVNGEACVDTDLEIGTVIGLGPYEIRVAAPTDDSDLAITIELLEPLDDGLDDMKASIITLAQTKFRLPVLSWVLGLVALLGIVAWPMYQGVTSPAADHQALRSGLLTEAESRVSILQGWKSGELSASHRFLTNSCVACHEKSFSHVAATSCLACHDDTNHHVDGEEFTIPTALRGNCTDCHREHRKGMPLVLDDERFCSGCHADIDQVTADTGLSNVPPDFLNHPPFKATVVTDATTGERRRVIGEIGSSPGKAVMEKSNLRFPHHVHTAKIGIEIPGTGKRRTLACSDCHTPDAGGRLMKPINMEAHCLECHLLRFDASAKERDLPHGGPRRVHTLIEDFYVAKEANKAKDRLEYGVSKADPSGTDTEVHRALRRAEENKFQIVEFVFTSVCGVCHVPLKVSDSGAFRWSVEPVSLARHWYPKAEFNHGPHRTVLCAECHAAETSTKSSDILLPKIDNCQRCHGSPAAESRVPTTCITCHALHRDQLPPMAESQSPD